MAVTMQDVANEAGVSVATVSHVLAKRRDVPVRAATRERVLTAARRLNYQYNALAAGLRRGATRMVGIQLYSPELPALVRKIAVLEQVLREAGLYPFLGHVMDEDAEIVGSTNELVDHQGHDGCLRVISRNPTYHRLSPRTTGLG